MDCHCREEELELLALLGSYLSHPVRVQIHFPEVSNERTSARKKRRVEPVDISTIHCDKQLTLFPVGVHNQKYCIKFFFYSNARSDICPTINIPKPRKLEEGARKVELFDDWIVTNAEMPWDQEAKCYSFTTPLMIAKSTSNLIYELTISISHHDNLNIQVFLPLAIPSKFDQIPRFITGLLSFHQQKIEKYLFSGDDWFVPVISNAWVSFLEHPPHYLDTKLLELGCSRFRGGDFFFDCQL